MSRSTRPWSTAISTRTSTLFPVWEILATGCTGPYDARRSSACGIGVSSAWGWGLMRSDKSKTLMSKDERWQTSLTSIAPDKILVRGYALDEMMGRLTFAEAV